MPAPLYTVSLTTADEGARSWPCSDWESAYADARDSSTPLIGALLVTVRDGAGVLRYHWQAAGVALEPARVLSAAYAGGAGMTRTKAQLATIADFTMRGQDAELKDQPNGLVWFSFWSEHGPACGWITRDGSIAWS